MPSREEHLTPRRYQAARVRLRCPAVDTPTRQLTLERATICADGWARWAEMDLWLPSYLQADCCCDPPEVSAL